MPNLIILEQVRKKYLKGQIPFMDGLRRRVQAEKPYQGLRILHNIPLTIATLCKIEVLVLGGADVTTTWGNLVPPQKKAVDLLKQANLKIQIEHNLNDEYDFHLDCCADLVRLKPPKIGAVELTQTGSEIYKKTNTSYVPRNSTPIS